MEHARDVLEDIAVKKASHDWKGSHGVCRDSPLSHRDTGSWIWVSRFRFHIAYRYSPIMYIIIICLNSFYSEQHSREQAKHTWRTVPASAIASSRTLCLRLAANDHNWWTTIPGERHQQTGSRKRKEQKMKPVHYFQVPSLITCFNVGNNLTTNNASNILSWVSMFLYKKLLFLFFFFTKKAMVWLRIKPKIMVLEPMVTTT